MPTYRGYARVSTKDQSDHSIDNQLKYLQYQAGRLGLEFQPYHEKQSGKSTEHRLQLQQAISDLQVGDYLGVYDNSRLGRNTQENIRLAEEITEKKAYLHINGKKIDINNPNDKLTLTIESAVSTYQRENQLLKSQIGLDTVWEQGEWIFSSSLYGYRIIGAGKNKTIEVVPEEAETIKLMYQLYSEGISITRIAEELNKRGLRTRKGRRWTPPYIRRYLSRPIYIGYYRQKQEEKKDITIIKKEDLIKSKYYPPILEEDLFWKVAGMYRKINPESEIKYRYTYNELSGVIKCAYCGASYVHFRRSVGKKKSGLHYYVSTHCREGCEQGRFQYQARIIEPLFRQLYFLAFLFLDDVQNYIDDLRNQVAVRTRAQKNDINRLTELIREKKKKIENLYEAIEDGLRTDRTVQRINNLEEEIKQLEEDRRELEAEIINEQMEIDNILDDYSDDKIREFIKGSHQVRRRRYLSILDVKGYSDKLEINYKINNMRIVIPTRKNKSRWDVQTEFSLKIYRKGKYFTTLNYDVKTNKWKIIEKEKNKKEYVKVLLSNLLERININYGGKERKK